MNGKIRVPEEALRLALESQGDTGCLLLEGSFAENAVSRFEDAMKHVEQRALRNLILDLRGMNEMDADDLSELVEAWWRTRSADLELILVRVPKHLRKQVEECGLEQVLPISYEGSRFGAEGTAA